ncbi:MAG TPA: AraC family transcriptional regulator [Oceanospirillaceae bacterium]|nr:AraC family transcriptional regulator [Oceanospirillaceae bacterium]
MNTSNNRINQSLYALHKDIAHSWTAAELAGVAAYSVFHFQRLFKQTTGENLNDYLRRVRLEAAANALLFSPHMQVQDVALRCGFQSVSSFSQRFKSQFGVAPGHWREQQGGGYLEEVNDQHNNIELIAKLRNYQGEELDVSLCQLQPKRVAYVRHTGYDRSIKLAWHQLQQWCENSGISWQGQNSYGLFHSNPDIVPIGQCKYVACIGIPDDFYATKGINVLAIPGGLYAKVYAQGVLGDFLPIHHQMLHDWLPRSGYESRLTPCFAHYQKNQFIDPDEQFELDFYVPVLARLA